MNSGSGKSGGLAAQVSPRQIPPRAPPPKRARDMELQLAGTPTPAEDLESAKWGTSPSMAEGSFGSMGHNPASSGGSGGGPPKAKVVVKGFSPPASAVRGPGVGAPSDGSGDLPSGKQAGGPPALTEEGGAVPPLSGNTLGTAAHSHVHGGGPTEPGGGGMILPPGFQPVPQCSTAGVHAGGSMVPPGAVGMGMAGPSGMAMPPFPHPYHTEMPGGGTPAAAAAAAAAAGYIQMQHFQHMQHMQHVQHMQHLHHMQLQARLHAASDMHGGVPQTGRGTRPAPGAAGNLGAPAAVSASPTRQSQLPAEAPGQPQGANSSQLGGQTPSSLSVQAAVGPEGFTTTGCRDRDISVKVLKAELAKACDEGAATNSAVRIEAALLESFADEGLPGKTYKTNLKKVYTALKEDRETNGGKLITQLIAGSLSPTKLVNT